MQSVNSPREAVAEVERDVEEPAALAELEAKPDIEHVTVRDDPRAWSPRKKAFTFAFVCFSSMASATSASIYLPAIADLRRDLSASQQVVNLSVSVFILVQGVTPILWSGISEIYGRRVVYVSSYLIFTVCQAVCAGAQDQITFLVFRILSAVGSSAVLATGAGTLADIYDPEVRGYKIGSYYLFPLLGPSLGTLLGGALALSTLTWRAPFIFMAVYGLIAVVWAAAFFHDTFRQERSLAWIAAFKRAEEAARAKDEARRAAKLHSNEAVTRTSSGRLPWSRSGTRSPRALDDPGLRALGQSSQQQSAVGSSIPQVIGGHGLKKITTETGEEIPVKIHLSDVNPLAATGQVLRQPNLLLATLASGLIFAASYSLSYTAALSFAATPYNYDSLKVGLVLLAFGIGNMIGSIAGGKYSDIQLARFKAKNGGKLIPEARIRATLVALPLIPLTYLAYAWMLDKEVHIAALIVILFILGLAIIWVYSPILSYLVDASTGMASSAVSCNSASRGLFAFAGSQSAEPLLSAIGNGVLYSIWAGIMLVALACVVLIYLKGRGWREKRARKMEAEELAAKAKSATVET